MRGPREQQTYYLDETDRSARSGGLGRSKNEKIKGGPGLGPAWARLGPGLGPAWARLGPCLGPAWARLGPGLGLAWAPWDPVKKARPRFKKHENVLKYNPGSLKRHEHVLKTC